MKMINKNKKKENSALMVDVTNLSDGRAVKYRDGIAVTSY